MSAVCTHRDYAGTNCCCSQQVAIIVSAQAQSLQPWRSFRRESVTRISTEPGTSTFAAARYARPLATRLLHLVFKTAVIKDQTTKKKDYLNSVVL